MTVHVAIISTAGTPSMEDWRAVNGWIKGLSGEIQWCCQRVFEGEEVALGGEAAGVAGEGAVRADDAVAGDEDGKGVGADCVGYGADCSRMSDAPGQFAIGRGAAERYLQQLVPYLFLKLRACEHQRHVELASFARKIFAKLCHGCLNHG